MRLFYSITIVVMIAAQGVCAQSIKNDLQLLDKKDLPSKKVEQPSKRTWNPITLTYLLGIKFYQRAISEQLATSCAYELTCSRFSKAMVKDCGFVKGYFLTFDRISRCNQISALETYPIRLTAEGKIIETTADFHFH